MDFCHDFLLWQVTLSAVKARRLLHDQVADYRVLNCLKNRAFDRHDLSLHYCTMISGFSKLSNVKKIYFSYYCVTTRHPAP